MTVDVLFAWDNLWLTQRTIADLFGVRTPAISKHLKNTYESGELTKRELFPKWKQFRLRAVGRSPVRRSFTTWMR